MLTDRTPNRARGTAPAGHRAWVAALLATGTLVAASSAARAGQLGLQAGGYASYHDLGVAWQSDALWQHPWRHTRLDLSLEASAGRLFGPAGTSGGDLWRVGLTPLAQWWFLPTDALEIGIGANLFSGTRIGGKTIATAFQFGDSIGLVHRFAASPWSIGLRLTHYSNADIKRPNPGQNYVDFRLGYTLP